MRILKLSVYLFLLAGAFAPVSSFAKEKEDYIISFQFENDFFGGGTDRHFSHGTRIELYTDSIPLITKWADKLPWFDSRKESEREYGTLEGRATISLGQNIYTPENTYTTNLVTGERPYAGWLYMGFGLMANQGAKRYDKLLLEVGVVGPSSLAQDVQTFWHSMFGLHVPEGWDHQLKNEPGIVLHYEQAYRFSSEDRFLTLEYDLVPHIGGALGNVYTHGSIGYTVRLGRNLEKDFGAPRIQPGLPGGGYFTGGENNWFFFVGMQGRVVLRNIFLDGNTFKDSPSVEKKYLVGDIQTGITLRWKRIRMSYTQIMRTSEFKGQDSDDIFGSLSISFQF